MQYINNVVIKMFTMHEVGKFTHRRLKFLTRFIIRLIYCFFTLGISAWLNEVIPHSNWQHSVGLFGFGECERPFGFLIPNCGSQFW